MPVVTISRGSMSGGQALAECLAQSLGVPCVGREILIEAAAAAGVSTELLASKMERSPGLWERVTSARKTYLLAVQAELAEHVARGDLVYHGLAGHLLLASLPGLLRVRLIAPLQMRVENVMSRHGLSREAALEYVEQVDDERMRWTRMVYGVELKDSSRFDLVVNLETMSLATACRIVATAAAEEEFRLTDADRAKYRAFALHCRATLASHGPKRDATSDTPLSVLVSTDRQDAVGPIVAELRRRSMDATVVAIGPETEACAGAAPFDALLALVADRPGELLPVLRAVRGQWPALPVVVAAGDGNVDVRIEAMQLGAADFVDLGQSPVHIASAVEAAIEAARTARSRTP